MFKTLRSLAREYTEYRRFVAGITAPRIVFYAEDQNAWPHFEPIITELTGALNYRIAYVTSSATDPILARHDPQIDTFFIGSGTVQVAFFQTLRYALLVMTMPDLGAFHIKRSSFPEVHYVYVHHSMVSTHMAYRRGAFDHFDTVFCVGPHHVAETRANEHLYRSKVKTLVEHGYGRLDTILSETQAFAKRPTGGRPHVVLAPSWGPQTILEQVGATTIEALLQAGFSLTVRPHPRTRQHNPGLLDGLAAQFSDRPSFVLEENMNSRRSLMESDVMLSDWSGAALEYAFGVGRPVVFIDVPRKVNNPEYERVSLVPVEVSLRSQLGAVVGSDDTNGLCREIERLVAEAEGHRHHLSNLRSAMIFNVSGSGSVGARAIQDRFVGMFWK